MTRRTHLHFMHRGPLTMLATNKHGSALAIGDVVVIDTTNNSAIKGTTTAAETKQIGIVMEAILNNAEGHVAVGGFVDYVNVTASVTRGHYAFTSTTTKKASGSSARAVGAFAQFLTGGTTPAAWLFGVADMGAGGGGGSMTVEQTGGTPSTASVTIIEVASYTNNGGGDVTILPEIDGQGVPAMVAFTGSDITIWAPDFGSYADILSGGSFWLAAPATAGALSTDAFTFFVGQHAVRLFMGELDSHTIQLFGDNSGFYSNIELTDQSSSQWKSAGPRGTFVLNDVNRGLASIVAAAAIANTETVVASASMPADSMQVGTTFRVKAYGRLTSGATPGSSIFRFRIGTTTLTGNIAATLTILNATLVTNGSFELEMMVTIRTAGAGGTAIGNVSARGGTVSAFVGDISAISATVAVDTTAVKLAELTYISGNAGSTATFENAVIELVRA